MMKSAENNEIEKQIAPTMQDYKEISSRIADDFGANATYVEDLLRQFQHNPKSVDEEWGEYFESLVGGESVKAESRGGLSPNQAAAARAPSAAPAPAVGQRPSPPAAETPPGERI